MTSRTSPRSARFTGLDGLRAVAVALVVVYHLFPDWILKGGFVGVDVFFVLSGFLITSLLLAEHEETGRIALRDFWRRRARRLLPALALVVTVCASAALLVGGDALARVNTQVLGAATFGYNWFSIAAGSDYFSAATPELFRNLWSLAVEEQFYVLWPLVLPLLLLVPRAWMRAVVAVIAAAGSAAWMEALIGGGDITRAYFGTDAHAFGILLGVALAFALRGPLRDRPALLERPLWRPLTLLTGILALGGMVAVATIAASSTVATFPGTMLAASALAVVAIVAGVLPGSWFGRALDIAPMRWLGERSYGIYLWHWPLLVLATTAATGAGPGAGVPLPVGLLVLASTLVVAELSYRFLETPVRRLGFRGAWGRFCAAASGGLRSRLGVAATASATALLLGGTTAAIAVAPVETTAESAVQAGITALEDQGHVAALPPDAVTSPVPAPSTTPVSGAEISAIGDSVMLASAPALMGRFPGVQIDAAVSRSMYAGPGIVEKLAASGQLRRYVVVALGTNGAIDRTSLDRMEKAIGPDRDLILVTAYAPRDWVTGVNAALTAYAEEKEAVELADWCRAIAPRENLLAGDRIHPDAAGGRVFADTVARAIDEAQIERLERQHAREALSFQLNRRLLDL